MVLRRLLHSAGTRSALKPPEGQDWLHEIKHDGHRLLAIISDLPLYSPYYGRIVMEGGPQPLGADAGSSFPSVDFNGPAAGEAAFINRSPHRPRDGGAFVILGTYRLSTSAKPARCN